MVQVAKAVQSLQQVQVEAGLVGALEQQVLVLGGCLPPNPRHPHLEMVAEVDLQIGVAQLDHSVVQVVAAAQAKESRAYV